MRVEQKLQDMGLTQMCIRDRTITITDNGLGMTAEEVDEYINQIAFSGAQDFLEKYKDKANEDQIIGHFGLGFYSAFMAVSYTHLLWESAGRRESRPSF